LNLLIVYNSALDAKSVSGVQRYFADVVEEWVAMGHRVDFLAARGAWPVFQELFPNSQLISSDDLFTFPAERLRQTWRYMPAFAWRMITPFFLRLPCRYDVVLACAQFAYEIGPSIVLARRQNAAVAVKIHHIVSTQRRAVGFFDRLQFTMERVTARWIHRWADAVLCTTRLVAADFNLIESNLGLTPTHIHCTGNGVNLRNLQFQPLAAKEFDAVLLGRVHAHKGIFDAPEIWRRVRESRPGARLLIIGEGPHRLELARRFEALGMTPDSGAVEFTGGVADGEKNRLLSRCRVGLSLSREEGWGLSITEFMALGLPVVAMDLPVFREVFEDQLDLVPKGDVAAAAARIVAWISDPAATEARAVEGRRFIERYDHRRIAHVEYSVLAEAVRSRQTGKVRY
jgi:glycosyltransferase involved in cell wall biosynthesis